MARTSLMDKAPELRAVIADGFLEGKTNQLIADEINKRYPQALPVNKETITDYRRHPEVAPLIEAGKKERELRAVRKLDHALLAKLDAAAENMSVKELVEIRKALVGETHHNKNEEVEGETLQEKLMKLADTDPAQAEKLMVLLSAEE